MRGSHKLLVGLLLALLVAGCGGSAGSTDSAKTVAAPAEAPPLPAKIKVTLNAYVGAENVGLLMAEKLGYFDDVGLNVWVGKPAIPSNTVYYVVARIDEIGVVPLPRVAIAREHGLSIVAVGSLIPQPTAAMIWLKGDGIQKMGDLKGKRIGISGVAFQKQLLRYVLEKAGLTLEDVEVAPVGYRLVPALLKGEVDAIFGGSPNVEGVALASQGADPVIKRVQDFDVPPYDQLAVITREDRAAADPEAMRAFMTAVQRGTAAAAKHPKEAAKLIVRNIASDPRATLAETEAELKATLPLLSRTGRLDHDRTTGLLDWMHAQGWIKQAVPASEVLAGE